MAVLEAVKLQDEGPMYAANGSRTYYQTWNVRTDTEESWQTVATAIGIVQYQTAYYRDQFALATEMDAKQDEDDENYWIIKYTFSTKLDELAQVNLATSGGGGGQLGGPQFNQEEPLSWAPKVRWSTKMFKYLRYRDQDGQLYCNAAGEMFPLPSKEYPRLVLSVKRNVPYFNVNLLNRVVNGVNMETTIGYEPRRIKCEKLTATPHTDKQFYWELDGEFIIGSDIDVLETIWPGVPVDGWWYDKRLNAGYMYLRPPDVIPGDAIFVPIYEPGGQRPSRPRPLSEDGFDVLNLSVAADLAQVNYLYFRELTDADFNATGIFNP